MSQRALQLDRARLIVIAVGYLPVYFSWERVARVAPASRGGYSGGAMIPLRDSEAERRLAPATVLLIVINLAVFTAEGRLAMRGSAEFLSYAMVPARVAQALQSSPGWRAPLSLFTSMFLHAGVLHLVGNLLYLLIFGPAVETRMGHLRFVGFYFAAGLISGLATVLIAPASLIPVIGASGAIAGVLGGYFVLFPRGRITTIWLSGLIEIPAVFYLLFWFALQLYSGIASGPEGAAAGGVAWWSHVGGFLFGLASAPLLVRKSPSPMRRA